MSLMDDVHLITSEAQLALLFDQASESALRKEAAHITPDYRALIEASPFAVLATSGRDGLDASPRGDRPGFVAFENPTNLLLPERRGNNRVDSLRNIIEDPRVALLFLIPGHKETLRVNGRARISVHPDLLDRFIVEGKRPKCVLSIQVDAAFFQCGRAILRSKLWEPLSHHPGALPTAGQMLAALTEGAIDGTAYDRELPGRQQTTLY